MKIFNKKNVIPFIIIFICVLIFFGILRNKKVEKINNIMENFIINDKFENFLNKKDYNIVVENSNNFNIDYINGKWTCPSTKLDNNNNAINLIEINISDNKKGGTINIPGIDNNRYFNEGIYNIIYIQGLNIMAQKKNSQYTLSFKFINTVLNNNYGENKLIMSTNIPMAILEFLDKNNKVAYDLNIYKIPDGLQIDGQLKNIILSQNYNTKKIIDKYNIDSYLKIIGKYNFAKDAVNFFPRTTKFINNINNINIKNKYNGKLTFSIAREFYTPDGTVIKTPASNKYTLDVFKGMENNQMPQYILINSIKNDNNDIDYKKYKPKSTIVYFHKLINQNINYEFRDNYKLNQSDFNFMNNGNNMFKSNNYNISDLNSLEKIVNANYQMILFKTFETPTLTSGKFISLSELNV